MARFISFTTKQVTASGEKTEIMFVNIDHVSTARYQDDGSLLLKILGAKDGSGAVEHYILHGEEAKAAVDVLRKAR